MVRVGGPDRARDFMRFTGRPPPCFKGPNQRWNGERPVGITGRIALASTALAGAAATAMFAVAPAAQAGTGGSFIGKFNTRTTIGSTVPANGDVNPYGTVLVTKNQGALVKGNVLISNFNNSKNLQGTGTTIVQSSPKGKLSVFAQINAAKLPGKCPGGVGLTTALDIL